MHVLTSVGWPKRANLADRSTMGAILELQVGGKDLHRLILGDHGSNAALDADQEVQPPGKSLAGQVAADEIGPEEKVAGGEQELEGVHAILVGALWNGISACGLSDQLPWGCKPVGKGSAGAWQVDLQGGSLQDHPLHRVRDPTHTGGCMA